MCFQVVFEQCALNFVLSKLPADREIESVFSSCLRTECIKCKLLQILFHMSICIKLSAIGEFGFLCLSCQLRLIDIEVCQVVCSIALMFLVNVIFDHECC